MKLVLTAFAYMTIGFSSVYSLSLPGLVLYVYSTTFQGDTDYSDISSSDGANIPVGLKDYIIVKFTKSFKKSTGFYKSMELWKIRVRSSFQILRL